MNIINKEIVVIALLLKDISIFSIESQQKQKLDAKFKPFGLMPIQARE